MNSARKTPVFYDGDCALCRQSVALGKALDLFGRLEFLNSRDSSVQAAYPDLETERTVRELVLKDPKGRWIGGFHAVRWMAWRLPVGWIVAPLLSMPGMDRIGNRLYRWVAENRYRFGACGGSCPIPAPDPAKSSAAPPARRLKREG